MWNDAEGFPVLVFVFGNNASGTAGCPDGYMKAFGLPDEDYEHYWVFVKGRFAERERK
jgi:hypothetical protein